MKPILAISCFVLLLATTALSINADIARPRPVPSPTENKFMYSSLQIVPDAKANNARLQIRQSDLKELTVALNGAPSSKPLAASITHSGTRTIIAGLMLFASLSFAGVWLARASRSSSGVGRGQKTVAIVLVAVATMGAAAIITRGNAGPPPSYAWRNLPAALAEGRATGGQVLIEVVPDDQLPNGGMKLTIPLRKLNAKGEEE
jgi:hypothetical protein